MAIEIALPDPTKPKTFSTDGVGFPHPLDESPQLIRYRQDMVQSGWRRIQRSGSLIEAKAHLLFIPFVLQVQAAEELAGIVEWYRSLKDDIDPEKDWLEVRATITDDPPGPAFLVQVPRHIHRKNAELITRFELGMEELRRRRSL